MAVAGSKAKGRERARSLGWRALGAFANRREASILVVAIGLIIYFSLRSSSFYSGATIKNIAEYVAPVALITRGEVMLLICGEIDLSVGRVFALSPIIMYLTVGAVAGRARAADLARSRLRPPRRRGRRADERADHDVPRRAVVHHDVRNALLPERDQPASVARLPGGDARGPHVRRDLRGLPVVVQLGVLVGAARGGRPPDRARPDEVGSPHGRDRRQPDRRAGERRQRPLDQDRQLRALQHARRLRRDHGLRPGSRPSSRSRAARTSCSSPSPRPSSAARR